MKFMVHTDSHRVFIEYISEMSDKALFYWEPDHIPTIEEIIAYGDHTHTQMMNYADYRRKNMVYPWT